jgi:hypothetical protein
MRETPTLVVILLATLACTAGCSGGSDEGTGGAAAATTTTAPSAVGGAAIRCLHAAGLAKVERQALGVWTGEQATGAYAIVIHELAKPARAPRVVAGSYALAGSFKVAAEGRGLTTAEGLEADDLVQSVAAASGASARPSPAACSP